MSGDHPGGSDPARSPPFERFLSAERGRPPDIDVDFEAERREEVIQYCYRRYGRERAAMVANVITYRARSVLQDVGKAFGLTQAQVNGLTKYLDTRSAKKIEEHLELPPGRTTDFIIDVCRRLDGFPRHLGIHSGGMVIADRPLWETVPLEWGRMEDRTVLQWDKDDCASMGIVKFDLLALGMLNALHLTVDLIEEVHGSRIDLAGLPQEPVVYEMLTKADTVGMFQVESRAQMATLPRMKPKSFYDLAVEVALIRPGPIQGHSVHPYLRRRNGEEPVTFPHPLTEPILRKTLGVPVFQEQLMELARVCAGYSPGQSDRLRQAMTHKRSDEEMEKLQVETLAGMERQGITGVAAAEIWDKLQGFASFGFPGEPLCRVRLHRVHVGVAQVPLARRVPRRSAQCPADGLLQPELAGAGLPSPWGDRPRSRCQRFGVRLHGDPPRSRSRRRRHLLRDAMATGERCP